MTPPAILGLLTALATLLMSLLLLGEGIRAPAQVLPRFATTSLSGLSVVLPDAARGRVAVLILGFTSGSAKASRAWRQRMDPEFGSKAMYSIYDLAILEDVPRVFRGMVAAALRKGIPAVLQDSFLTSFQNEKTWKELAGFNEKDDAYVMVLDRGGALSWKVHGLCTNVQYEALRSELQRLAAGE